MLPDYRVADKLFKMTKSKRHKFSRDELETIARAICVLEALHDFTNITEYSLSEL